MDNWKRNTALFLTGQCISLFGSMLVHYSIMWYITLKTQSGWMMTLIAIAAALPMFLIAPFGGVWADRHNKKRIITLSDAAIAIITLLMALVISPDSDYSMLLLICLASRALGQGVQSPAINALIPELVPQEQLARINGIHGSIQSAVLFASPMAGGALLAIAPLRAILLIDVTTAIIGIGILLLFVKTPVRSRQNENQTGLKQYLRDISEGLNYIGKHPFAKKLIALGTVFYFMYAPAAVLTQLQVVRNWGDSIWTVPGGLPIGPEQRLAALNIVFFVGMTLGGLVMGVRGGFKDKNRSMMLALSLFGLNAALLGLFRNFWIYLFCVALCGIMLNVCSISIVTLLQTSVDSTFMGRVFSVLMMISSVMTPLGMVVWGPLADIFSIDRILIGTGGFLFALGFILIFNPTPARDRA
ncbi:MAG: MFS transporter [Clostridiales bacterium]|nr:MFS transporter [Clostridiales bacterium]